MWLVFHAVVVVVDVDVDVVVVVIVFTLGPWFLLLSLSLP